MKRTVFCVIVIWLSFLISFNVLGDDIDENFKEASKLYAQKRYKAAIEQYQNILAKGYESGNVYFNIGDCYFKLGQLGQAVVFYERAQRLIPRDSDLEKNYEFAVSELGSQASSEMSMRRSTWKSKLYGFFNINELTIVVTVLYGCMLFIVLLWILRKRIGFWSVMIFCSMLLYGGFGIKYLLNDIRKFDKEAIILAKSADVKYGPFDDATTYFQLYEGDKVELLSEKEGWIKIRRLDNKTGWIKETNMEKI